MERTGNTIIIKDMYIGCRFEKVPVMRNGKPTKATKEVCIEEKADLPAIGFMYEGHEIFILERDVMSEEIQSWGYPVFKADGSRLTCNCKFGRYGQANHEEVMRWYKEQDELGCGSRGYEGPTGRGWGAVIRKINW